MVFICALNVLVILAIVFQISFARRGTPCITPNRRNGMCVTVSSCKAIYDAIESGTNTAAIEYSKQSICGYDSQPLVCCELLPLPPHIQLLFSRASKIKMKDVTTSSNVYAKTLPDRTVCGLIKWKHKVLGGHLTEIGEFPWMVALEYKSKRTGENAGIRCGGSLINNRYVLTAAHCINNVEFQLTNVRLGEWNINTDPDCPQPIVDCLDPVTMVNVTKTIPHPYYKRSTGDNDIGLLRLEKDIEYSIYIRPICLPPLDLSTPKFGTNLTVAGWGTTETGNLSDVILKVQVPLLPNRCCRSKLEGVVDGNQLCAGGEPGKDSCQGDSGGPLMRLYEDSSRQQFNWYQEGVVAHGTGCGRAGYPAVYTRVRRFMKWIISNIRKD